MDYLILFQIAKALMLVLGVGLLTSGVILVYKHKAGFLPSLLLGLGFLFSFVFIIFVTSFNENEFVQTLRGGLFDVFVSFSMIQLYWLRYPAILFAVAITVSNIVLLKKEGKNLKNLLGTFVGIFIFVDLYIIIVPPFDTEYYGWLIFSVFQILITNYFIVMLLGSSLASILCAFSKPKYNKDFIIILGCGLIGDRVPPLLAGRVERGIKFYKKQIEKTGKIPHFIVSGGKGSDEKISEADGMKRYLLSKGIPEEHIIVEDKSTTTKENMMFSKKIIDEINPNAKCVFSTTKYHAFRSSLFAQRAGLSSSVVGSKTKWYFWPNAFLREFIGMLSIYKFVHIALLLIILTLSVFTNTYMYIETYGSIFYIPDNGVLGWQQGYFS